MSAYENRKTSHHHSQYNCIFLAILKFCIGIFSGSIAILASAIDSLLDMGISLFNMIAIHNASKDPDANFNYGRGKAEALSACIEGIIITISAIFIGYESIQKIIHKTTISENTISILVMMLSTIVTGILVMYLQKIAEKSKNIIIESDALHYKTDVLSNLAILTGLIIINITKWHFIDAIIGLFIAVYIAFWAFKIFKKWILLLLDVSLDIHQVTNILKTIQGHPELKSFHNFRSRTSGGINFIEAHLVFDSNISLINAHRISHEIEDAIRESDTQSSWSILFHLDPYNDEEEDKKR